MNGYLIREQYLELLRVGRGDTGIVKVITGMRRAGKSVVMEQCMDDLRSSGVADEDMLFVDFESIEGQEITDRSQLNSFIKENVPQDRPFYVFFDEIQNVKDWEMSVSAINRMRNVDLYITGSNSDMLSSQLATHISGRHVEIRVFPLSFKEFMELHGYDDRTAAFKDYLQYGGLPAIDPSKGQRYAKDYLDGVYNTVIVKDVLRHVDAVDASKVDAISRFIYSNIGNITNTASIATGTGLSVTAVNRHIGAMEDAFLFMHCDRYDMVGKKLLKTNGKYYAMDIGIRNAVLGLSAGADISRPLENIVYIELLRRGYDVRVGSYRDSEIDFVAERYDSIEYFQVCQTIASEGTLKRETGSLMKPKDGYRKTILTLDEFGTGNESGIEIRNLLDWLLDS